eukprot:6779002-Ditylum_brightwellii.AAC.1
MVLRGPRNKENGSWDINLIGNHNVSSENNVTVFTCDNVNTMTVKKDIVNFLHAAAFSPTERTWKQAIKHGFFTT